jgi:hypothetical protein
VYTGVQFRSSSKTGQTKKDREGLMIGSAAVRFVWLSLQRERMVLGKIQTIFISGFFPLSPAFSQHHVGPVWCEKKR